MVKTLLIPAYYKKEIILPEDVLNKLKNYKIIALFASVQFIKLEKAIKQIKKLDIEVIKAHGKRTSGDYQLLGCDCLSDSFSMDISKAEAVLYIGDGMFHPKALLLAKINEVIVYDPLSKNMIIITQKEIEKQKNKYKANLMKYLNASNIGVLVSLKPGQYFLNLALELKKKSEKNVFIFLADSINYSEMENFPFVKVWVNTACPRMGFDDVLNMKKPLININDAFNPEKALQNVN